jgi:hypothetical protein
MATAGWERASGNYSFERLLERKNRFFAAVSQAAG